MSATSMEGNKVSIIIPVYNVELYLDECVYSVVNQSYQDIEIILVDDGSTDCSGVICDYWKEKDSRIIVVHKENGGLSSARNVGLELASSSFVSFVDSDDTVSRNLVETAVKELERGFDAISFGYYLIYEDYPKVKVEFDNREYSFEKKEEQVSFLTGPFFQYKTGWMAWCFLFRKHIVDRFDIRFVDTKIVLAEDLLFTLSYLSHCSKVKTLSEGLYNYRQRTGSLMDFNRNTQMHNIARMNNLALKLFEHYSKWDDCGNLKNAFPAFHYFILERNIQEMERSGYFSSKQIRKMVFDELSEHSDYCFFHNNFNRFDEYAYLLDSNYSFIKKHSKLIRAKGIIHPSLMYHIIVKIYHLQNVVRLRKFSNENLNCN